MKPKTKTKLKTKEVKIRVKSQISDLMLSDTYSTIKTIEMINNEINNDSDINTKRIIDFFVDDAVNDLVEYNTYGKMTDDGENITIHYEESELLDLEGLETMLIYNKNKPDIITMIRTGTVITSIIFDQAEQRYICNYLTEFAPIEFCIYTNSVINNSDYENGGIMILDYDIEIHGVRTERNKFCLQVTNIRNIN
ncbi:MAG: DUF1934 domain-containing protein [Oscillospiraceae bacterium]|nr:DUF1934 domain-containing protein [Oscillospiraceae bacterium]